MTLIAVLSGFGAINLPVTFFNIYDEKSEKYCQILLMKNSAFAKSVHV